jgi:hypothetical protein
MNNLSAIVLSWGPLIVQIVLLSLQIYTFRRTNHYSLVLLAAATTTGILAFGLGKILNSELLAFNRAHRSTPRSLAIAMVTSV